MLFSIYPDLLQIIFFFTVTLTYICTYTKYKDMEESIIYYVDRLNKNNLTGTLFKYIKYPEGSPFFFTCMNVGIFVLLGSVLGLSVLMFIPCFYIVWKHYELTLKRNLIVEDCLVSEIIMKEEFKTGIDPNYPDDPLYITEEDRYGIFHDSLTGRAEPRIVDKLKSHHVFIIIVMASYILASFIAKYYLLPV